MSAGRPVFAGHSGTTVVPAAGPNPASGANYQQAHVTPCEASVGVPTEPESASRRRGLAVISVAPQPGSSCSDVAARPTLAHEQWLWDRGFTRLAGVDEAGRGALAGPLVAAAVVLPPYPGLMDQLAGLRDSKLMTP